LGPSRDNRTQASSSASPGRFKQREEKSMNETPAPTGCAAPGSRRAALHPWLRPAASPGPEGDRAAACANFKKALAIFLKHFDDNHPHVKSVRKSMQAVGCGA